MQKLFSNTKFGDLCKIGFGAIYRHADRYGLTVAFDHIGDAVQEGLTECLEEGVLTREDLEGERVRIEDHKMHEIARRTVNSYRRLIHRVNSEEILSYILEDGEERDYLIQGTYPAADSELILEDMWATLEDLCIGSSAGSYQIMEMQVKGMTQQEIARELRIARKTVARRIEYLQDHITTGLVQEALYPVPDRQVYRKAQKMTTGKNDPLPEYPISEYRFSEAVLKILEIYRAQGISL